MGFPYDEASWSVVDGAMYMGAGGAMPGLFTLIAAIICAAVLIFGQKTESAKTRQFDK
ncbi:hypothetical protein [Poseidonocella sedimentorum]|uniref:Uncharacterized protein n=1 Tax=Poseidonocella sedimentorum TaxID=871652 RepID=A0A1I6DKJ3_9RHOB|nr:hypothetical protein [Poseidonocella sedimentorum]SFR05964.1 hypothetical protein SAMN04515673_10428 [Poseidonocella sedimentorum]